MSQLHQAMLAMPISYPNVFLAAVTKDLMNGGHANAGALISKICSAASIYMAQTHPELEHSHVLTLSAQFIRPVGAQTLEIVVEPVKLGSRVSILHVHLFTEGKSAGTNSSKSKVAAAAYLNMGNFSSPGPSIETYWKLEPPRTSVDLDLLSQVRDQSWRVFHTQPFPTQRVGMSHLLHHRTFSDAQPHPYVVDSWMCLRDGERFSNAMLGYLGAAGPMMYDGILNKVLRTSPGLELVEEEKPVTSAFSNSKMDFRKGLPETGVQWLFWRGIVKEVKDGRAEFEHIVMNEKGELGMVATHIAIITELRGWRRQNDVSSGRL